MARLLKRPNDQAQLRWAGTSLTHVTIRPQRRLEWMVGLSIYLGRDHIMQKGVAHGPSPLDAAVPALPLWDRGHRDDRTLYPLPQFP